MKMMTRYTCEEAFRRLDDYLDRELAADEMHLVHEHLQGCEMCAREFAFEEQLFQEVRTMLNRIEMPPDLHARLFSLLDEERSTSGDAP
jgi:anti-sigma factor (TIGR02949 family)